MEAKAAETQKAFTGALDNLTKNAPAGSESAVAAFQGGAFEYLPKPFDLPKAVELIRRAVDEARGNVMEAARALGISRATLYRQTQPATLPVVLPRAPSPRRLSDLERQAVLDVLHTEEFVDQPPSEVHARLLSRGVYLASLRTMYRVLAASGETCSTTVPYAVPLIRP